MEHYAKIAPTCLCAGGYIVKLVWATLSLIFAEIDAWTYGKEGHTSDLVWTIVMFLLFTYYMYGWLHRGEANGGDVHKGGISE